MSDRGGGGQRSLIIGPLDKESEPSLNFSALMFSDRIPRRNGGAIGVHKGALGRGGGGELIVIIIIIIINIIIIVIMGASLIIMIKHYKRYPISHN